MFFDFIKPSARSLQSPKKLFDISKGTVNHERLSEGILVSGVKSLDLSYSERQIISNVKGVPVDDVPVIGWCCRSLLKPKHSFEGLLYRVGEHVTFADPEKGLFSVKESSLNMMNKQKLVLSKYA